MRANNQFEIVPVAHPRQLERVSHSGVRILQRGDGPRDFEHGDPMETFHSWDLLKAVVGELDNAPGDIKVCGTVAPHFRDSIVLVNFFLVVHEFPLPHKVDAQGYTSVRFPTLNSHAPNTIRPRVATLPHADFCSERLALLNSRRCEVGYSA